MTYFITSVSVAQGATIINAIITFIHVTISLSLVILLIYFMPKSNTALAWSSISRALQSSSWPVILRTDSESSRSHGAAVSTVSFAAAATTGLVAIAGILLPLGLSEGPTVASNFRPVDAQYIPDNSALALATTPERGSFVYGRTCGFLAPGLPCPGNNSPNDTNFSPQVIEIFNSTPHGPFTMEYRKFFDGEGPQKPSTGLMGAAETFILRNDTFVAEGLIIDMSLDHPGIGFWNQTLPPFQHGGTWSQDILWLEPVTQCVDTNLTVDYLLMNGPSSVTDFNITDHGGFANLSHEPPSLNRDGQHIDLWQHAYKGAAYSDLFAMDFLNLTREGSHVGASYPVDTNNSVALYGSSLGSLKVLPISYLNGSALESAQVICQGYGKIDTANVTNVHVNCGIFLGPPLRTDGGDPRMFDRGSKWSQNIHACSSATRASVQTTTFSTNNTNDVHNLRVTRATSNLDVLWATEKTDLAIREVDLLWGRVADKYENDSSLWTVRADGFYLPAGGASVWNAFPDGQPSSAHAHVWGQIYDPLSLSGEYVTDYSGKGDYSIKTKMQSLVARDPTVGNAQIRNLIWTDMMANNVIGTQTNNTIWAADHLRTLQYNFKYAIPGFILLLIWLPSFLGAIFLLATRSMTFERMRAVLNHTSVGRVVIGTSALRVQSAGSVGYMGVSQPGYSPSGFFTPFQSDKALGHHRNKSDWANTSGKVQVALDLQGRPNNAGSIMEEEDIKLIETPRR